MRELILVRHGETDWNREQRVQGWTDQPLNERGREQSRRLAARLRGRRFDAIHASDLRRAAETATILAAEVGGEPPVYSGGWRELRFGELEGTAGEDRRSRFREALENAREDVPFAAGAESYREFAGRIVAAYQELGRAHAGGTVLVVTHGGAVKALVAHVIGLAPRHARHLSAWGNTGVSRLWFGDGHPQLTLLNDISHLDARALSPPELP